MGHLLKTALHIVAPLSASAVFLHVKAWMEHFEYKLGCHKEGLCYVVWPATLASVPEARVMVLGRKEGFPSTHTAGESPYACGDAYVDVSICPFESKGRESKRAGPLDFGKKLIFIYPS